jgi:hypothetical protein
VDEIAKKKGFKPLTTQEHEWLAQLESQYSRPDISAHEKVALAEQMMGILRHSGLSRGHVMKVLGESFAASLLSGIRTTTLNVLQPWTTMAVNLATHAAFQPKDFPMLMKSMVDSAKMWWPEFRFAFSRYAYEMASSERVFHSNHLKRVFEQAQMDWRKAKRSGDPKLYSKAFLEFAYGWQQYVVRALAAADQAGMAVARDWKMALYGSMAMREAGFSTKDISRIVDVVREGKDAAFQDALDQGYGKKDADVIANEKAREALRSWFADDKRLGLEKTVAVEEAAVYDAFSIVGRRAPHVIESDEGFLSRYLGVNWVMRRATEARMEGGGASIMTIMAVGFMNVPLRTARYYAGFGPYGLLRAGINKYRTSRGKEGEGLLNYWEQSYHNTLMSKARLREAIVGTALALGFFGWQSWNSTADDDAEKKEFALYVTGMGPANRTLRDAWQKRGFQPFTLHIVAGNKVVSQIPITRAGQIFGFPLGFAAAVDDLAWRRKQEAATGKAHQEFGGRELAAIAGTYYQIAGAQGVFQAAGRLSQIGQGDVGLGRFVGMQTASLASGLLPGKSLIQGLADITYGPVDRSSIEAAMAANFPVLGAFVSGKAINRLGDPIGEGTWEAKLARMGFPVVFRLSDNKENKAIYQLLLDKGAAPPDLRRYVIEDAYGPLNQDQWSRFVAASGGHLKRLISDNLAGLQTMQPQDVKSFMNRAGQMANNQAGIDIGLQRQAGGGGYSSAGTGGGGGLSGSAAPAIPKAPRVSLPGGRASVSVGAAPRIGAGLRRVGYGRRFGMGRGLGAGRFHRGRKRLLRSKRFVSGRVRIPRSRFSRRIRFSRRPRLASFA